MTQSVANARQDLADAIERAVKAQRGELAKIGASGLRILRVHRGVLLRDSRARSSAVA